MSGTSPLPWFAFSLSLSPDVARERLRNMPVLALPDGELAEALDVELVYDVQSADWGGKVARLVDAPGRRVMGLLRRMPPHTWAQVERLEAALAQAVEERPLRVRTASGATLSARAFTPPAPAHAPQGVVSVAFLEAHARAAERASLPATYVERLQAEARIVQTVQRAQADRIR
ncbi:gamma-glutamylcyclotransferase [Hyalangium sp.]|uniref:gamma-glutamylcyclotransferase n=1 Tax=Hyalangium sp. TaxID=2028555 RepID=UPI002D475E0A|nr:gamma-glutamylcyclotransferase [Hyalangium sp.]HYH96928.1 gamma-glutamylcyclotransferase [Hyalangium sp.]